MVSSLKPGQAWRGGHWISDGLGSVQLSTGARPSAVPQYSTAATPATDLSIINNTLNIVNKILFGGGIKLTN